MDFTQIMSFAFTFLFIALGFLGCFVHKINGPLMAFIGIVIFYFMSDKEAVTFGTLAICAVAVAISMICNRQLPKLTKLISDFSKFGTWGAIIGSLIGLILVITLSQKCEEGYLVLLLFILSFIVLPFGFAFILELIKTKNALMALKSGIAAFVTFLMGMMIKLGVCVYCVYTVVTH